METKNYFITLLLSLFCIPMNAQLKVLSNGKVGIGTTNPQYGLLEIGKSAVIIAGAYANLRMLECRCLVNRIAECSVVLLISLHSFLSVYTSCIYSITHGHFSFRNFCFYSGFLQPPIT